MQIQQEERLLILENLKKVVLTNKVFIRKYLN